MFPDLLVKICFCGKPQQRAVNRALNNMEIIFLGLWVGIVMLIYQFVLVPAFQSKLSPGFGWLAWFALIVVMQARPGELNTCRVIMTGGSASVIYHLTSVGFRKKREEKETKEETVTK